MSRYAVFCGKGCERDWRAARWRGNALRAGLPPTNAIVAGTEPWNKGLSGIHLSPETEFKKGHKGTRRSPVGAVSIRTDKNGTSRAWVKVAEPNRWRLRAVLTWEKANGRVPCGYVVHHHDHDSLNDDISNLRLLTRAQHADEHRGELTAGRWGK